MIRFYFYTAALIMCLMLHILFLILKFPSEGFILIIFILSTFFLIFQLTPIPKIKYQKSIPVHVFSKKIKSNYGNFMILSAVCSALLFYISILILKFNFTVALFFSWFTLDLLLLFAIKKFSPIEFRNNLNSYLKLTFNTDNEYFENFSSDFTNALRQNNIESLYTYLWEIYKEKIADFNQVFETSCKYLDEYSQPSLTKDDVEEINNE